MLKLTNDDAFSTVPANCIPFTVSPFNTVFDGKLTALLYKRFHFFNGASEKGLIVIPCELIDRNGDNLKKIVLQYATDWNLDKAFVSWINNDNIFCNTLVDRIVPGYPRDKIDTIAEENNLEVENASAVTQYDPILVGAGVEPYIIGSSFSLEPDETSELLKGNNGVYIIRLLSKEIAEEINLGQAISNSLSDREIERISTLIPEVLESKAEIVDNRSFYY